LEVEQRCRRDPLWLWLSLGVEVAGVITKVVFLAFQQVSELLEEILNLNHPQNFSAFPLSGFYEVMD